MYIYIHVYIYIDIWEPITIISHFNGYKWIWKWEEYPLKIAIFAVWDDQPRFAFENLDVFPANGVQKKKKLHLCSTVQPRV